MELLKYNCEHERLDRIKAFRLFSFGFTRIGTKTTCCWNDECWIYFKLIHILTAYFYKYLSESPDHVFLPDVHIIPSYRMFFLRIMSTQSIIIRMTQRLRTIFERIFKTLPCKCATVLHSRSAYYKRYLYKKISIFKASSDVSVRCFVTFVLCRECRECRGRNRNIKTWQFVHELIMG